MSKKIFITQIVTLVVWVAFAFVPIGYLRFIISDDSLDDAIYDTFNDDGEYRKIYMLVILLVYFFWGFRFFLWLPELKRLKYFVAGDSKDDLVQLIQRLYLAISGCMCIGGIFSIINYVILSKTSYYNGNIYDGIGDYVKDYKVEFLSLYWLAVVVPVLASIASIIILLISIFLFKKYVLIKGVRTKSNTRNQNYKKVEDHFFIYEYDTAQDNLYIEYTLSEINKTFKKEEWTSFQNIDVLKEFMRRRTFTFTRDNRFFNVEVFPIFVKPEDFIDIFKFNNVHEKLKKLATINYTKFALNFASYLESALTDYYMETKQFLLEDHNFYMMVYAISNDFFQNYCNEINDYLKKTEDIDSNYEMRKILNFTNRSHFVKKFITDIQAVFYSFYEHYKNPYKQSESYHNQYSYSEEEFEETYEEEYEKNQTNSNLDYEVIMALNFLSLKEDCSYEEFKKAFRFMAKKLHPDVNKDSFNAEKDMRKLNIYRDVLEGYFKNKKN
ncbi:hypothetical protein SCHIN_v1c01190 [Spiroplasma chinense]|uniref:J domain-containing protein n=1 Tax=Spiroplasma chinense TaxID=216932 RepID=A0A5B9Y4Y7_9MOLU|nr:J domain-containing protein [Spiroplasma chinense]QEH61317.1 hypothetical protein SCHIN_v1c01190 [Spiroplasma chinense]